MIDSVMPEAVPAELFERLGVPADAETVARVRTQFADWLSRCVTVHPDTASDLILAANEALANAAEYAYLRDDRPGTMDLQACYRPDEASLVVTVADHGCWRMADPDPATRTRGRGIPLMHALTDRASIETTERGTTAWLEWDSIRPS